MEKPNQVPQLIRHSLVAGFEDLFDPDKLALNLPCVLSVRNFDVFRVVKQLAIALDIKAKFWGHIEEGYYAVLHDAPISGVEIARLIYDFEHRV